MSEPTGSEPDPNVAAGAAPDPNVAAGAAPDPNVAAGAAPDPNVAAGAAPDPWRSFRGVMAGTLILEAIVVLLALPVVGAVGGGLTGVSAGFVISVAILLLLLSGLQGRPWAIWANVGMQVLLIAGWAIYPGIGFIGVLFLVVWLLIVYLRAEVLRRQRRGQLPGQSRDTA